MRSRTTTIATVAAAAALGITGIAAAADGPTQVTVETVPTLTAGATAPFDAPGVKAIRLRKAIPSGYVLIGRKVTIKRGEVAAGATLFFRCPGTKRLKTFGTTGTAGFGSIQNYVNHRQTYITSFRSVDSTGVVYAVCR
jgi:hypothetical protein